MKKTVKNVALCLSVTSKKKICIPTYYVMIENSVWKMNVQFSHNKCEKVSAAGHKNGNFNFTPSFLNQWQSAM